MSGAPISASASKRPRAPVYGARSFAIGTFWSLRYGIMLPHHSTRSALTQHFCHSCATSMGIPAATPTERLFETPYQLAKYMKHTAPGTAYDINSVFSDPSTAAYAGYVVSIMGSGWYQVDDWGRYNMTWYAGSQTGAEYRGGTFHVPASGVKVVCYQDEFKIHAYPDAAIVPATTCLRCGIPIPYNK